MKKMASVDFFKSLRNERHQFYLVVCEQSDADTGKYVCGGGLDLGLNDAGMEEAKKLARRFKKNPLKLKRMISCPELRTIQMADILHDEMRLKLALWREFADQFMGEYEGKPLSPSMDFSSPPSGETLESFTLRVRLGLERLLKEKDLILLVTHLRVAKVIFKLMQIEPSIAAAGKMFAVDWPEGEGIAHAREV